MPFLDKELVSQYASTDRFTTAILDIQISREWISLSSISSPNRFALELIFSDSSSIITRTYRFFGFLAMTPAELSIDLMTDKQCISSASLAFGNVVHEKAYASPRTEAPALIAKKGTAPQRRAAHGAEPGFESECAMYRYPAVAVNRPIAVELSVRSSLIRVSTH